MNINAHIYERCNVNAEINDEIFLISGETSFEKVSGLGGDGTWF